MFAFAFASALAWHGGPAGDDDRASESRCSCRSPHTLVRGQGQRRARMAHRRRAQLVVYPACLPARSPHRPAEESSVEEGRACARARANRVALPFAAAASPPHPALVGALSCSLGAKQVCVRADADAALAGPSGMRHGMRRGARMCMCEERPSAVPSPHCRQALARAVRLPPCPRRCNTKTRRRAACLENKLLQVVATPVALLAWWH